MRTTSSPQHTQSYGPEGPAQVEILFTHGQIYICI